MQALVDAAAVALGLRGPSFEVIDEGWDFDVALLNGEWIVRAPKHPPAAEAFTVELSLLPTLAGALPVAVPKPQVVLERPRQAMVYRAIQGERLDAAIEAGADPVSLGRDLGSVLAALHAFPVDRALELGVPPDPPRDEFVETCLADVVPLLDPHERGQAAGRLEQWRADADAPRVLVHADLGPEHARCRDGRIVGVIDWGDVRVGDCALDLWWLADPRFAQVARGLEETYGRVDDEVRGRAGTWFFVGPCMEVHYGLGWGGPEHVRLGLEGVRRRLALE